MKRELICKQALDFGSGQDRDGPAPRRGGPVFAGEMTRLFAFSCGTTPRLPCRVLHPASLPSPAMQDVGESAWHSAWNNDRLAPVQPSQPEILTFDRLENTESRRHLARSCTALWPGFALALTPL
jgi:hypothetical protein